MFMDKVLLIMIGVFVICVILVIIVLHLLQRSKTKRIKKELEELEIEKNKLDSSPIIPELAKVESFLNNEKLEVMYNEWTERLKKIRDEEIPKLTDMLIDCEYSLDQGDYKTTIYKIAKLEMEIYKVRTKSDFLLGEIKEITTSEERSRKIITAFKVRFRNYYQYFEEHKSSYPEYEEIIKNQFALISKQFEEFETIMEQNEYTEVNKIIKVIEDLLKHMKVVIEEVPSILLLATSVLPKKIKEVEETYNHMVKASYPLDYLNVEYNVEEANKKINDILDRLKELNLEDSLFELKVLMDYFDSLFNDFEKEKLARFNYNDAHNNFKNKLNKMNGLVNDVFTQIAQLKAIYNLKEEDVDTLKNVKDELKVLNDNYKVLVEHTENNTAFAYSKLLKEIETLTLKLSDLEEKLNTSLEAIGTMKDDEVRARQQLEDIKKILKEAKLKIRDYNLPVIPNSYYTELKEAQSAIREIVKELDKKPITINVLNTRVDTARDLVLKFYSKTKEMLKLAAFSEMAIVYGNRYRSSYEGLNERLNMSEQLFYKGNYQKSLELTINVLNRIEPGIYERLTTYYNENR